MNYCVRAQNERTDLVSVSGDQYIDIEIYKDNKMVVKFTVSESEFGRGNAVVYDENGKKIRALKDDSEEICTHSGVCLHCNRCTECYAEMSCG